VTGRDLRPLSDGTVTLRAPTVEDLSVLNDSRDAEFFRWLGAEAGMDSPLACLLVDDQVTGWIDYDVDRPWLEDGEVNIGYFLLAPHRGKGYATRALELLLRFLGDETDYRVATLLIDTRNERSLAVARRAGFSQVDDIGGGAFYFKRAVQRSQANGGAPSTPGGSFD
jgi:RimJ/RimL family protein N-acetyltransferase